MRRLVADSCFTAAYGGKLVIVPERAARRRSPLVGNTFGYGARARAARTSPAAAATASASACASRTRASGPRIVVEGVEANAFQYMTGGVAPVLGPVGFNLGAGMTGGRVYLYDLDGSRLNRQYVRAEPLDTAAQPRCSSS